MSNERRCHKTCMELKLGRAGAKSRDSGSPESVGVRRKCRLTFCIGSAIVRARNGYRERTGNQFGMQMARSRYSTFGEAPDARDSSRAS